MQRKITNYWLSSSTDAPVPIYKRVCKRANKDVLSEARVHRMKILNLLICAKFSLRRRQKRMLIR